MRVEKRNAGGDLGEEEEARGWLGPGAKTSLRKVVTFCESTLLYQATHPQVLLDDNICSELAHVICVRGRETSVGKLTIHGSHNETDLHGICRTSEMRVDLLGLVLVERHKAVEDVVTGSGVVSATLIIGEVVLHRADRKLLLEAIDLVEEQDYACLDKPPRVADAVEKSERLLHAVDGLILEEELVVFGNSDEEQDCSDVLEAVNPLLTFGTLSTDIEHTVGKIANDEGGLGDTGGLDTGTENILVVRSVIRAGNAIDRVKVAKSKKVRPMFKGCSSCLLEIRTTWRSRLAGTPASAGSTVEHRYPSREQRWRCQHLGEGCRLRSALAA